MIKAIIFDCFGVLAVDGWLPFKRKHFGSDPELIEQATSLNKQCDAGLIAYDEYVKTIAELAHVSPEAFKKQIEDNPRDDELFNYIATKLKPNYKIGLLSNAAGNYLDRLFKPDQVALFDAVSLSFESGFIKPDPQAFQDIANKLGLAPAECLFVDDQERYCVGARETGMPSILYEDFEQLKIDLKKLLSHA